MTSSKINKFRERVPKLGVGLSGGGYRASIFHLGVMEAMNDIKFKEVRTNLKNLIPLKIISFLEAIDNLSTVSGGSIVGTYMLLKHKLKNEKQSLKISFSKGFKELKEEFLNNILSYNCERYSISRSPYIILPILILIIFVIIFSVLKYFNTAYFQFLYASIFYFNMVLLGSSVTPLIIYSAIPSKYKNNLNFTYRISACLISSTLLCLFFTIILKFKIEYSFLGFIFGFIVYIFIFTFKLLLSPLFSHKKLMLFQKKIFFGNFDLSQLPDYPRLAINSAIMETGDLCIFTNKGVFSKYNKFPDLLYHHIPIAEAVSSSSNFPPIFESLRIKKSYFQDKSEFIPLSLTDGGSIDNHGICTLTAEQNEFNNFNCNFYSDIIIIADAELPVVFKSVRYGIISQINNLITKILIKNVRELNRTRALYLNSNELYPGAIYISLSKEIGSIISEDFRSHEQIDTFKNRINELEDKGRLNLHNLQNYSFEKFLLNNPSDHYNYIRYPDVFQEFIDALFDAIGISNKDDFLYSYKSRDDKRKLEMIHKIETRLIPINDFEIKDTLIRHAKSITEFLIKFWLLDISNDICTDSITTSTTVNTDTVLKTAGVVSNNPVFELRQSIIDLINKKYEKMNKSVQKEKIYQFSKIIGENHIKTAENAINAIKGNQKIAESFKENLEPKIENDTEVR